MKLSVCTISFRHHLISIEELARWAQAHGFHGIELWGAHARNLAPKSEYGAEWLSSFGLTASMLSDYLPVEDSIAELRTKVDVLSDLAVHWGVRKVRTFAGSVGSARASTAERRAIVERLRTACDLLSARGLLLLIETHPRTLADTAAATMSLISEVDHPSLRVNFDVLHLWEAGDEPQLALALLRKHVAHYHLKNVSQRELLDVFAPANVYSPAGSRRGMVPLFDGAFDYRTFLAGLACDKRVEASLEWFGDDVKKTLRQDRAILYQITASQAKRLAGAREEGAEPAR